VNNEVLNFTFKYDKLGKLDPFYELVTDCFPKIAYSVLKQEKEFNCEWFWNSMVNGLLLATIRDCSKSFYDFQPIYIPWNNYINFVEIDTIDNPILCLEETINKNGYAIVQTITPLIEFISYYDPNFNSDNYKPGHAFLLLHYDNDYYYYHQDESIINYSNYTPLDLNKEIGIIHRSKLDVLFNKMLYIYTIVLNNSDMANSYEKILNLIKKYSLSYFNKSNEIKNSLNTSYGHRAIKNLRNNFGKEVDLTEISKAYPFVKLGNVLVWRFSSARNSRRILNIWLKDHLKLSDSGLKMELNELLDNICTLWGQLTNKVLKESIKQNKSLNIYNDLHLVLLAEDGFVRLLKNEVYKII